MEHLFLNSYYRQYVRSFPLDIRSIGPLIAKGKQHRVHAYGDKHVIKIPRASIYMQAYGRLTVSQVKRDVAIIARLFPHLLVPTDILTSPTHPRRYVIIQEYIPTAQPVTLAHFSLVRSQLQQIYQANQILITNKQLALDIFGYYGLTQTLWSFIPGSGATPQLTNLLLDTSNTTPQLKLVDTNLSQFDAKHGLRWSHRLIDWGNCVLSMVLFKMLLSSRPTATPLLAPARLNQKH